MNISSSSGANGNAIPRQSKLSEALAREILRSTLTGSATPGQRLPTEAAMIDEYRVGRATLREALRLLELFGVIQVRPGRGGGPVVSAVGPRDFASIAAVFFQSTRATYYDLLEIRLIVEPTVARFAAEQENCVEVAEQLLAPSTAQAQRTNGDNNWSQQSHSFHTTLHDMIHNPILSLTAGMFKSLWSDRVVGTAFPPEKKDKVDDDHGTIAEAIRNGDGHRSELLMRQHMEEFLYHSVQRFPGMMDEIINW